MKEPTPVLAGPKDQRTFVRNRPRLTLALIMVVSLLLLLSIAEISLRLFLGLGDPLLYQSSPLYGYRPQSNQFVRRVNGAEIRVNNLGLRAEEDWDASTENKILFMGNSVTFGGTYMSNQDLFSSLAVRNLKGYHSGNAGVNGWGVENMHALIVDYGFLPASVYVTVLQDMDFERGFSKFAGQPFWSRKPRFALEELLAYFLYSKRLDMQEGHDRFVTSVEREKAIERSVFKLKELDEFLRTSGYLHLIYFSSDTHQLLDGEPSNPLVARYLQRYGLQATFIRDRPEIAELSNDEKAALFHDWNHLDQGGHILWGKIIGSDLKELLEKHDE